MVFLLFLIKISALSHAENRIPSFEYGTALPIKTSLIMPLVTGAAKTIYEDVAQGIKSNNNLEISILMIDEASSIRMVEQHILENNSELVIALGNTSYRLAALLPIDTNMDLILFTYDA